MVASYLSKFCLEATPGHASAEGGRSSAGLHSFACPSPGSSQLLAMPSCLWNLDMSSFSFSAVLTLWKTVPHCPWRGTGGGARRGEEGSCLGHLGLWSLRFHGKSGLWACLSVVPLCEAGVRHPAAGPVQRHRWSHLPSQGLRVSARSSLGPCAGEGQSGASNRGLILSRCSGVCCSGVCCPGSHGLVGRGWASGGRGPTTVGLRSAFLPASRRCPCTGEAGCPR